MPEPKTILVVDDDVELSDGLRMVLEKQGYRVIQARDGQQGQHLVYQQRPDLVILDMMMPRMGGYPVLEHFRNKPDAPPIIMITANEGSRHKAYAEYLGVVDYIRKPFAMERLLEAVERGLAGKSDRPPNPRKRKSEFIRDRRALGGDRAAARGPGSPEGFIVRRAETLRFMGGFHAFPGGRALPADAELAAAVDALSAQRVAAVRELFEETGVLLARRQDGAFPDRRRTRRPAGELLADAGAFPALLRRLRLTIRSNDLLHVGNLTTPPFSSIRFDAAFFTAIVPPGQTPRVQPGELDAGEWLSADAALAAWEQGRILISPPTASLLETIRGRPVEELARAAQPLFDALAAGSPEGIYFSPQVQMTPLFCKGLPPTYYTNAFLVGRDPAYLIDPGPAEADEQQRLFTLLDARREAGARLAGVLLTHHHRDHIGAADAAARRYGVPILAHPWTARALAGKVAVDREIGDGARLDLGTAPHGGPWRLEALHTPGHAPGHLCFYEPTYRLLFAGDMASTLSSVVITPPEGDLTAYLESLRRLRTLPIRLLLPAHGAVSARPHVVLDEAVNHRRKREEQLVQALASKPRRGGAGAGDVPRGAGRGDALCGEAGAGGSAEAATRGAGGAGWGERRFGMAECPFALTGRSALQTGRMDDLTTAGSFRLC